LFEAAPIAVAVAVAAAVVVAVVDQMIDMQIVDTASDHGTCGKDYESCTAGEMSLNVDGGFAVDDAQNVASEFGETIHRSSYR
jgi:hypothetical protein